MGDTGNPFFAVRNTGPVGTFVVSTSPVKVEFGQDDTPLPSSFDIVNSSFSVDVPGNYRIRGHICLALTDKLVPPTSLIISIVDNNAVRNLVTMPLGALNVSTLYSIDIDSIIQLDQDTDIGLYLSTNTGSADVHIDPYAAFFVGNLI